MKGLKGFASMVCAAILTAACAVPAFAAGETYSITIKNSADGHTYEAYQVFSGDLSEGVLSNIEWGVGVTQEGVTAMGDAAEKAESIGSSVEAAEAFAIEVEAYLGSATGTTNTVVEGNYVISGLEAGYYLIKDKDGSLGGANDSYTTFILKVVGNTEASPKNSIAPTVEKEVQDEAADAEEGAPDGWGASADHAIGESFQFRLLGTIPADEDYASYKVYKLVFADTMSEGITFESIASVTVNGTAIPDTGYTCTATAGQAGGSWTLTIHDLLLHDANLTDGAIVEVLYNAHLNTNASSDPLNPNSNTVNLKYSNNPNVTGEGAGEELGETPDDAVWVFTYGVDNTKEDAEKRPLAGAGFKLYSDEACTQEIPLIYDEAWGAYRPVMAGETGEEMISALETGKFDIYGLDAGTYYMQETTTPAGYNSCEVVEVVLTATHVNGDCVLVLKINNVVAEKNTVVNQKGVTLPSTGGTGTTLFYVIGAALVIGAGVLLVARRRTGNGE